jgi:hypothetical protein
MSYLECLFYFISTIVVIELLIEACKWLGRLISPTDWEVPSYVYWYNKYR